MNIEIKKPKLTSYQQKILNSPARYKVVLSSTKAGKSFLGVWYLFQLSHQNTNQNFCYLAPIYSQAEIFFDRFKKYLKGLEKFYKINLSDLTITLPNGSKIYFKSADNPDSLFGFEFNACVFDEFSRAKEESWFALRSTITYTSAPVLFLGNVTSSVWALKLAKRAKAGLDKDYAFFSVSCWDACKAGILKIEEIEEAKKTLPKRIFSQLYEAQLSENIENALWSFELLEDVHTQEKIEVFDRKVLAIDVAVSSSKESDETGLIISGKKNDEYFIIEDLSGTYSPVQLQEKIEYAIEYFSIDCITIEINNGGHFLTNFIRQFNKTIRIVEVRAKQNKFLRAESIIALYEQKKVKHLKEFQNLETEMIEFDKTKTTNKDDRVDALVYSLIELSKPKFEFAIV